MHTGRELSGSRGELDSDALGRIETEIVTIGQIIKTQFGEGSSKGDMSHRSMSEDAVRIAHLEVEKKELETKLKLAREAMNEYVTRLNDKVGTCCTCVVAISLTVNFPFHRSKSTECIKPFTWNEQYPVPIYLVDLLWPLERLFGSRRVPKFPTEKQNLSCIPRPNFWQIPLPGEQSKPGSSQDI